MNYIHTECHWMGTMFLLIFFDVITEGKNNDVNDFQSFMRELKTFFHLENAGKFKSYY